MKLAAAVLLMVLAYLGQQALAWGETDSSSAFGPDGPTLLSPGPITKKMEDRFAQSLVAITFSPSSEEGDKPGNGHAVTKAEGNGSLLDNSSVNASLPQKASLEDINQSSSEDNSTRDGMEKAPNDSDMNEGSSSSNRFKGFYATRGSRHEIGKGGVDSSIFLRGEFEMDKSIKFQDQGF